MSNPLDTSLWMQERTPQDRIQRYALDRRFIWPNDLKKIGFYLKTTV